MHFLLVEGFPAVLPLADVKRRVVSLLGTSYNSVVPSVGRAVVQYADVSDLKAAVSIIQSTLDGDTSLTAKTFSAPVVKAVTDVSPSPVRVLCFGDSNTWGTHPTDRFYRLPNRWPIPFSKILGCDVIEEGCGGRTAATDDPEYPIPHQRNGLAYLPGCLHSHRPLDLVIIMLGTNDAKTYLNLSTDDIADNIMKLVSCIRKSVAPLGRVNDHTFKLPILLVSNPLVSYENADGSPLRSDFVGAHAKLAGLTSALSERVAALPADEVGAISVATLEGLKIGVDGIHFDDETHLGIAQQIASGAVSSFPHLFPHLFSSQ